MEKNDKTLLVAVSSSSEGTNSSNLNEQFGRSPYFIFFNTATNEYESSENPGKQANSGAGIKAANLVINMGAKVVLTGQVGDKASMALKEAGIKVIEGYKSSQKIKDVIKNYLEKGV